MFSAAGPVTLAVFDVRLLRCCSATQANDLGRRVVAEPSGLVAGSVGGFQTCRVDDPVPSISDLAVRGGHTSDSHAAAEMIANDCRWVSRSMFAPMNVRRGSASIP